MTIATLTLTEFLLARIAEDEAAAELRFDPWDEEHGYGYTFHGHGADAMTMTVDPARVMAECEAKRRIVALHEVTTRQVEVRGFDEPDYTEPEDDCTICGWFPHGAACETVAALAAVYSDHPDYREEWRP